MANGGWYGTKEEWQRIEQPLLEVDAIIEAFATENSLAVQRNHKDWPERSLIWSHNDVRCLIQLYLTDETSLAFDLWVSASEDRGNARYWKHATLIKSKRVSDFKEDLAAQLLLGRQKLVEWSSNKDQLGFATNLQRSRQ